MEKNFQELVIPLKRQIQYEITRPYPIHAFEKWTDPLAFATPTILIQAFNPQTIGAMGLSTVLDAKGELLLYIAPVFILPNYRRTRVFYQMVLIAEKIAIHHNIHRYFLHLDYLSESFLTQFTIANHLQMIPYDIDEKAIWFTGTIPLYRRPLNGRRIEN